MLVFARRFQESFIIGDDVVITVLGIKGDQVRFGIDAPRDTPVHREEVYKKIQRGHHDRHRQSSDEGQKVHGNWPDETSDDELRRRFKNSRSDIDV